MPVYLIVDAVIHDRARFGEYGKATAALVQQFGGRYLVLGGGEMQALESSPGMGFSGKAVISEWPDRETALRFWNSSEYSQARKLREGICTASVTLVEGMEVRE
jgi:uncharacterized protein (DUF1330 family)